MNPTSQISDRMLRVRGTVQGVGFRPFVLRLARELGVRGWVRNDTEGVLARVSGDIEQTERFAEAILQRAPAASHVTELQWLEISTDAAELPEDFVITESTSAGPEVATSVPADLAPCADCRRELTDVADRRHGYPFINCTQCGPRYSIITSLPYDRPRTTMQSFPLCPDCREEYENPADRRFHAEPNACPVCGPRLLLTDQTGSRLADQEAALEQTVIALKAGQIVAVKGVGGFHLMTDATNEAAVGELRRRKHREEKPFAVMFRDLASLKLCAEVSPAAARLLESPAAPIVLVQLRAGARLASAVAPGNPWLGALLPSSPLHLRLLAAVNRPLIATSANLADEPLCTEEPEARARLVGIADLFLGHNRAIARPVDDSVVRFTDNDAAILLRRARGYAPTPCRLPGRLDRTIVCLGAQMKNTVAVAAGDQVVLSPHIGDLGGPATRRVFERTIGTLSELFAARVTGYVHDKHPDYSSTHHALTSGLSCLAVQHHLAHVLAVLLEHGQAADGVLGVAWDGTGYGEDGTIWGGEFILLKAGRARRFARLRPFRLLGGDAAAHDARRVALALTAPLDRDRSRLLALASGYSDQETATLHAMLDRGVNSPFCSSMGRLFDGFGALLGIGRRNAYEGQLPLGVEIAARRAGTQSGDALPFVVGAASAGADLEIDWQPAVAQVLDTAHIPVAAQAMSFHRGLIRALIEVAQRAGVQTVALSGGCFQNALLTSLAETALRQAGFNVLTARTLPPNDGAIAAGQALAALWNLTTVELPTPNPTPSPHSHVPSRTR